MFASAIGVVIAFAFFFFVIIIIALSTSSEPEPFIRDNSILSIKFTGSIPERLSNDPFEAFLSGTDPAAVSLDDLERNLKKAALDEKIKGVLLEIDFLTASWPVLQQSRRALQNFKESSGKFVYATTNDIGLNEQGYYMATVADSIFAPENTMMMFDGFVIEGTFYKGMLDKVGVKADVVHKGKYKSAGDSYIHDEFTDANREQLTAIFEDIVDEFESTVAARLGMDREEVHAFMNQPPRLAIEYYHENGLIDALVSRGDLEDRIKQRIEVEADTKLALVPNRRYAKVSETKAGLEKSPREAIAVIYADGPIMPDMGENPFGFNEALITVNNFEESLKTAVDDSNVKGIVVRINSPGGAGSTSDIIWGLIREASEKKPIVASMGAVAASGGYYIAMAADKIVAERTTITGSIGVIGIRYDATELLKDKMGLSYDEIRFHKHAEWLNPTSELTSEQRGAFEFFVDSFYDSFVNRVAESRDKTYDEIHAVAQGRVWSGEDALEIGLIDQVGGLEHAIALAAELSGVESYSIKNLPREKTFFEAFSESSQVSMKSRLSADIPFYNEMKMVESMLQFQRPQAWAVLPYFIEIK